MSQKKGTLLRPLPVYLVFIGCLPWRLPMGNQWCRGYPWVTGQAGVTHG
ncbi:hypothetical protein [Sulfitobacter litoralis]|nr:hypothetical protein [Sulfitobacter litoralis]